MQGSGGSGLQISLTWGRNSLLVTKKPNRAAGPPFAESANAWLQTWHHVFLVFLIEFSDSRLTNISEFASLSLFE
jgi:hypothetical protein